MTMTCEGNCGAEPDQQIPEGWPMIEGTNIPKTVLSKLRWRFVPGACDKCEFQGEVAEVDWGHKAEALCRPCMEATVAGLDKDLEVMAMSDPYAVSRRNFLLSLALVVGGFLLMACSGTGLLPLGIWGVLGGGGVVCVGITFETVVDMKASDDRSRRQRQSSGG